MRTPLFLSILALVACSQTAPDDTSSVESNQTTEGEPSQGADEGSVCWETSDCAQGLVCKARPSGPPPGAVGMPVPADHASSGPPPGAVGMPLPPNTCQTPSPGEEGSECLDTSECDSGLVCEFEDASGTSSSGGPPPGAVGLPIPADQASSGPPPGAVGLPIMTYGRCAQDKGTSSSGGPPPGAVGLPIFK